MATYYQAENEIDFIYDYVDEAGDAINISAASSVTLHLYLPDGTKKTTAGSYSATASQNRATATTAATTITNDNIGPDGIDTGTVYWQFETVVSGLSIWSPEQGTIFNKNLDQYD